MAITPVRKCIHNFRIWNVAEPMYVGGSKWGLDQVIHQLKPKRQMEQDEQHCGYPVYPY